MNNSLRVVIIVIASLVGAFAFYAIDQAILLDFSGMIVGAFIFGAIAVGLLPGKDPIRTWQQSQQATRTTQTTRTTTVEDDKS